MKSLIQFIKEEAEKTPSTERGKIKFTIWEEPDKKVKWIKDNKWKRNKRNFSKVLQGHY